MAVVVAAAVVGSVGPAVAAPVPVAEPAGVTAGVVTLPTGDRVRIDGETVRFEPAQGRGDGFFSPGRPGEDRVIIPLDVLDEVSTRTVDDRLFNVDALLRTGQPDARRVRSAASLGEPLFGRPRASGTTVTVRHTWLDGSVPPGALGAWVNLDTGDSDVYVATDGVATLDLPPGRYSLASHLRHLPDTGPWEVIGAFTDLTVTDVPAEVSVDGRQAKPITVAVDRVGAVTVAREARFFTQLPDGSPGWSGGYRVDGTTRLYGIPSGAPAGHDAGIVLRSELASPPGVPPYSYSLYHEEERGIPADPTFVVREKHLAVRNATYHGLGAASAVMDRLNLSDNAEHQPFSYLPAAPVRVPSTRTELYTADPAVDWSHAGRFEPAVEDGPADDVLHPGGPMTVGTRNEDWLSGPLSVRAPNLNISYYGTGIERWPGGEDANLLLARMPLFSGGRPGEVVNTLDPSGESVISKDGVELARSPDGAAVTVQVPAGDAGRYTVRMDATRRVSWTPFGTASHAEWTFDSAPVDDVTTLGVSAVRFDSPDVVDGYAWRNRPQRVELEYETQHGAADRACRGMTFEVSYDDGATWRPVDIERVGDRATATLLHPARGKYVSVRFTAVGDLGQTVATSTIRSFGLR